jgi:two-component system sensor histidine kinase BaeS
MSVRGKMFAAMSAFILLMGLAFVFLTFFVVKGILEYKPEGDARMEAQGIADTFASYYMNNGESWDGVSAIRLDLEGLSAEHDISILLLSSAQQSLYFSGDAPERYVKSLGIRYPVRALGETIALLYYYDPLVAQYALMRRGINSSIIALLLVFAVIFVLISLAVAFWLSGKLTAPLTSMVQAINRLGQGEYGTQATVHTHDEYGKLAQAFNIMSDQLQQAEVLRRNLVADVAHELRTPITIIRGKLELLQQHGSVIKPEQLLPLQDELLRLTRLVEDLSQLSLAEARKLTLDLKPVELPELLRRIVDHLLPEAVEKRIQMELTGLQSGAVVHADANRITQVFLNLLTNALRYTPEEGRIVVSVSEESSGKGERSCLTVQISDSGIGIPQEHLPHLFRRFYRTDEARNRHSGGAGLGLAIAKEFVNAHGGKIEVASRVGEGTTFTVKLPQA